MAKCCIMGAHSDRRLIGMTATYRRHRNLVLFVKKRRVRKTAVMSEAELGANRGQYMYYIIYILYYTIYTSHIAALYTCTYIIIL